MIDYHFLEKLDLKFKLIFAYIYVDCVFRTNVVARKYGSIFLDISWNNIATIYENKKG